MKKPFLTIVLLSISLVMIAQSPGQMKENQEAQKEAMSAFSWLIGEWTGTAWSQMGAGERQTYKMKEIISYDLDQTIVDVEGTGTHETGEMAHHAKAVISYDARSKKYRWHAWRIPGGVFTDHEPELTENGFKWAMETPGGDIRYSVTHTEDDGWFETGEFSADGTNWIKFFEMNLSRK